MIKQFFFSSALYIFPSVFKKYFYRKVDKITWKNMKNEESDLLLMNHFLTSSSVYFDVGANNGMFSYKASQIIKESNLYAFEPIPKLYYLVNKLFKNVHVHNLAFSNKVEKEADFKIPIIGSKKNYFRGTLNTSYREDGENDSESIQVEITTIDQFVVTHNLHKIDMIKIDVEGHELNVVKGAVESLKKLHPILQIEIEQRHHTYPIIEIINFVKALDYKCYYFDPIQFKMKLLTVDPADLQKKSEFKQISYINNFFFSKNGQFGLKDIEEINLDISQLRN